jgi:hypothetical protein
MTETKTEPQVLSIEQKVIEKLRALPVERQQQVLDFVEFLKYKSEPKRPRKDFLGALAHLNISVSEEDIAQARREMWGNFPRDFPGKDVR